VTSGLEALRSLLHENFLPALDRTAIILSRLKGLAQFHDSRSDTGISVPLLSRLSDIIGSLTLVGHRALLIVMEELDLFTSFSTWLRLQIDRLASTSSSASDEMAEREIMINQPAVLAYIQRYLTQSPLETFLADEDKAEKQQSWEEIAARMEGCLMDVVKEEIAKERERQEEGRLEKERSLTGLVCQVGCLLKLFDSQAGALFSGVAEAQRRSVRFGDRLRIVMGGEVGRVDLRMGAANRENVGLSTVFRLHLPVLSILLTYSLLGCCRRSSLHSRNNQDQRK
jgi:anaphase-promoting complex subunit 4